MLLPLFSLILLVIGVVLLRKGSAPRLPVALVAFGIGIAVYSLIDRSNGPDPSVAYSDVEYSLGQVIGQYLLDDLPDGGTVLVLGLPTVADVGPSLPELRFRGLQKKLKRTNLDIRLGGVPFPDDQITNDEFIVMNRKTLTAEAETWCTDNNAVAIVSLLDALPKGAAKGAEGASWYGLVSGHEASTDQEKWEEGRLKLLVTYLSYLEREPIPDRGSPTKKASASYNITALPK